MRSRLGSGFACLVQGRDAEDVEGAHRGARGEEQLGHSYYHPLRHTLLCRGGGLVQRRVSLFGGCVRLGAASEQAADHSRVSAPCGEVQRRHTWLGSGSGLGLGLGLGLGVGLGVGLGLGPRLRSSRSRWSP